MLHLLQVFGALNHFYLKRFGDRSLILIFLFLQYAMPQAQSFQLKLQIFNGLFKFLIELIFQVFTGRPLDCQGVFYLRLRFFFYSHLIFCLKYCPHRGEWLQFERVKKLHYACMVFVDFDSVCFAAVQGHKVIPPTGPVQYSFARSENLLWNTILKVHHEMKCKISDAWCLNLSAFDGHCGFLFFIKWLIDLCHLRAVRRLGSVGCLGAKSRPVFVILRWISWFIWRWLFCFLLKKWV